MLKKVRCRAWTTHGERCKTLTEEVRVWGDKAFPCCKRHPQWFWERMKPVGARGPNPYDKVKIVPDFGGGRVILTVKGKAVMDAKEIGELAKKVVISVEHGWLCFRTVEQKLLLALESTDSRVLKGMKLEEVAAELEEGFEEIRRIEESLKVKG